MRGTQHAEYQFADARIMATQIKDDADGFTHLANHAVSLSEGCRYLAIALREIYDKLAEIDRKVDALIYDAAHKVHR